MALFDFKSNRDKVDAAVDEAINMALEMVGQSAEGDVATKAPVGETSLLRQSISHKVVDSEKAVYIGSSMEYAPYVEFGTGVYAEKGGRQSGWWVYVKGSPSGNKGHKSYSFEEAQRVVASMRARGLDAYMSQGIKPTHFMRDAIQDNADKYRAIIAQALRDEVK